MTNATEPGTNPAAPREALLAQVPMFQLLDADERAALATVMREAGFPRGTVLFHHGDPGDETYIVTSGAIELSVRDKMGQPLVLTTAGQGDIFGELSLLDEGPRTATATAREDSTVLVLERQDLKSFVRRRPDAALDIMAVMARRMRATDEQLQQMAARNVNEEIETRATLLARVTDMIAEFAGSLPFLGVHVLWFGAWIGWNLLAGEDGFDPYPFGFLTLCVSLEAIFLSVIVLLSQNRQVAKDRIRSDIEYEVNLKAELEISHLHEKVDHLNAAVLSRLQRIENTLRKP
jgi:CRP/FNR family cyclic AMP-dependent transcriptional regulator